MIQDLIGRFVKTAVAYMTVKKPHQSAALHPILLVYLTQLEISGNGPGIAIRLLPIKTTNFIQIQCPDLTIAAMYYVAGAGT